MEEIAGVIYPVPKQFADRLLSEKRNVFVKYIPRNGSLRLSVKNRVLFYVSKSSKEIAGEGTIEDIEFLTPSEALLKHGEKLFLNEKELREYTMQQPHRDPSKKMLVLVLSKLRKFSRPKSFKKPITMAGLYFTWEEYKALAMANI